MLAPPRPNSVILLRGVIYTVDGAGRYYNTALGRRVALKLCNNVDWRYLPAVGVKRPPTYNLIRKWAKRGLATRR